MVVLGIDVWDGSARQLELGFKEQTGSTYPMLLKGSQVGVLYGFGHTNFAVVDHQGILRFRSEGGIHNRPNLDAIGVAIETSLVGVAASREAPDQAADPEPQPEEGATAVAGPTIAPAEADSTTWGALRQWLRQRQ